jgi:hypothetical protein
LPELKGELQDYLQENSRPDFAKCFTDEERLEKVTHLAGNSHHMNQLNKSASFRRSFDFK